MAVYYIGSYDIHDPDEFRRYGPLVMALLPKYGGRRGGMPERHAWSRPPHYEMNR